MRIKVKIEALYHNSKSQYAFAIKKNEIRVRFRCAKDDLDTVNLYYGEKFDWKKKRMVPMRKRYTDEWFDYYQYNIVQKDVRIGYYFEVRKGEEILYYTEVGIKEEFDDQKAYRMFFQYPTVEEGDLPCQPKWYKNAVFYQIFVERFRNGNPKISPKNLTNWDKEPTPMSFYGGDLQGILDSLDYLKELGITALYLTPIFHSESNHKYDTIDYFKIDEHFGDKETLHQLIDKAHRLQIKVILDAVFNHCSEQFFAFSDVCKNGKNSKYKDWFFIEGFPMTKEPLNYRTFSNLPYMPKLNVSNPEVEEYLLSVVTYWTKEFGVDGWRLDVADELSHQFLRRLHTEVKRLGSDLILIGEVWHDAMPWLLGDQFDSVMNYAITHQAVNYFAKQTIDAKEFTQKLVMQLMKYPDDVNERMFNLLDSHDTERFLHLCEEEVSGLLNAAAFQMAYVGTPCIYYGTEVGVTGGYDPGCRRGFPWDTKRWDMTIWNWYRKLIELRKTERALLDGDVTFESTQDVFIMKRDTKEESIWVLINQTSEGQTILKEKSMESMVDLLHDNQPFDGSIPPKYAMYLKKGE